MADTAGALSGAASGASAGATIGSVVPVIGTGVGAVVGGILGGAAGLLNKKKAPAKVPFVPVNLQDEQNKAISGDLSAETSIEQLLSQANRFTQDQANGLMERVMPGYSKLRDAMTNMATSNLANPYAMPADVSANLTRIAAERGITTGVGGQAGDFSLMRDLGVNMLDWGNSRINQAQSLMSTVAGLSPRVSPMSPISFYVTPGQQASMTQTNNMMQQGIDEGANNAATSAANWNTANMWDTLAKLSAFAGTQYDKSRAKSAGTPTTPAPSSDLNV